jgi:hypothetical protein
MVAPRKLVGLGIASLALVSCKHCHKPDERSCEDYLEEASPGFPTFAPNSDEEGPTLDFQVCDSAAADINGDGLLDFVAADHIDPAFGYFMNLGTTPVSFAEGEEVPFVGGSNSAGIVVEDFNLDGIPDVANSDHEGIVTVRINTTPEGAAIDEVMFPTAGETNVDLGVDHGAHFGFAGIEGGLVAADFNGDGKLDIATANLGDNAAGESTASVILNTTPDPAPDPAPMASFGAVQYIVLPGAAISVATADFDGDGVTDFATSNTAVSSISVLGNRTATGSDTVDFDSLVLDIPPEDNPAGAGPTNPVAADFNGDGKPDIATANWNIDTVTIFTNQSDAASGLAFATEPQVVELCFNPLVARHGDLDGDGDQDIVVIPLDLQKTIAFGVLENRTEAGASMTDFRFVAVVDLPDHMQNTDFINWLEGNSDMRSPGVWFASSGNVADFNADGGLEIAITAAWGDFAIELQGQIADTTDILKFVEPPINQQIADAFLPRHTELTVYVASP